MQSVAIRELLISLQSLLPGRLVTLHPEIAQSAKVSSYSRS